MSGLQPSSLGREAADLITRLSRCTVSCLIHQTLPAFGTQKWKMQSTVKTKVERFKTTLSMKLRRQSWMTSMALTSATDIQLCGSKGRLCFLHKLRCGIARGKFPWGKVEGLPLFPFSSCQNPADIQSKDGKGAALPTAYKPDCPEEVSCLLNCSLVCKSQTPLLPVTDMTGRKQICRPLSVTWNWINT